ncbi:MAG: hypothetical protein H0U79_00575, partial [Solirubrobacterales bacterium]|nr:hypothetical protein [Solirubrobacterales bacterium]
MPNTGPRRPRVRWPKPRDATVVLGVAALAAGAQPATAGAQMPGATNVTPALGQLAQRDPGR